MTYNDGFVFAMLKETNSNAMMVKINYSTGVVAARYHMNNVMENLLIRFEDSEVLQAYYGDDSAFHQMKYNLTQPTWAWLDIAPSSNTTAYALITTLGRSILV